MKIDHVYEAPWVDMDSETKAISINRVQVAVRIESDSDEAARHVSDVIRDMMKGVLEPVKNGQGVPA